jgi:uncharacterized protein (TIGR02594 family)
MTIDLFTLAQRYVGVKELSGTKNHPLIQWWLSLCGFSLDTPDEVAWCSAFVNGMAWELRLPRSKSAGARSWLAVGLPVEGSQARRGDVVILKRGTEPQPGAEVINAPGHVGLFAGYEGPNVLLLGGNQSDSVGLAHFNKDQILGVRRLIGVLDA